MVRPRAPHGTKGGYRGHKDRKERVCDACQRWKDGETTDTAPTTPAAKPKRGSKVTGKDVDFVAETLSNIAIVDAAMLTASSGVIGPLSKRKSELLRELKDYQEAAGLTKKPIDPLDTLLPGQAGGGIDLSNVTRLPDRVTA